MKERKINLIINVICFLMIAAYAIYIIVEWKNIPGMVPTHFNAAGKPDNYGSKASLIVEPIIALLLMGLFIFIEKFPQAWNFPVKVTEENKERLYGCGLKIIGAIKILAVSVCIYGGLSSASNNQLPGWPVLAVIVAMFVVVIVGIIYTIGNK